MNTKLLIDALVRQTTVLIAQLSTAAGIRAPLAHVADQVFLELSRELEAQGLGKRVVADMFGLLIRGYQKKVQRLTESASVRDKSLWEAVLEFVTANPGSSRKRVLERFARDGEEAVRSVLRDLVSSGLLSSSGQGSRALYRPTSEEDRQAFVDVDAVDSLVPMLWATIFHNPGSSREQLAHHLKVDPAALTEALDLLRADGRVRADDWDEYTGLSTAALLVPVDSEVGWEAAVFDHFQAVSNAIAAKVRTGKLKASHGDAVGGATLRFELGPQNPHEKRVLSLLEDVRRQVNQVWEDVRRYNEQHPPDEHTTRNVCFYFGQYLKEPDDE
jgi:hypothetical protein